MTDLPKFIQEWPNQWSSMLRRTTKTEMQNGSTFEEALEVAEATCRLEFAIQNMANLQDSQETPVS